MSVVVVHHGCVIEEVQTSIIERRVKQFEPVGLAGQTALRAERPGVVDRQLLFFQFHSECTGIAAVNIAFGENLAIAEQ